MSNEELLSHLFWSLLPHIAMASVGWSILGLLLGGASSVALYLGLARLGWWEARLPSFVRILSALWLIAHGAGLGVIAFGTYGVYSTARWALLEEPEARALVEPVAVAGGMLLTSASSFGNALEAGQDATTAATTATDEFNAYLAGNGDLDVAHVQSGLEAIVVHARRQAVREAFPEVLAVVEDYVPEGSGEYLMPLADFALESVLSPEDGSVSGFLYDLYDDAIATLGDSADADGDPKLSQAELTEHVLRTLIAPMLLSPLAEILFIAALSFLLPGLFTMALPVVFYGVLKLFETPQVVQPKSNKDG
jgi:hypothetical protein